MNNTHTLPGLSAMLDEVFGSNTFETLTKHNNWSPKANIIENEDAYSIEFIAPGFEKENFNLNLTENKLSVTANYENKTKNDDLKYNRKEFSIANFDRSFTIPKHTDKENITAKYTNGILTITIPKKEEVNNSTPIKVI